MSKKREEELYNFEGELVGKGLYIMGDGDVFDYIHCSDLFTFLVRLGVTSYKEIRIVEYF